MTLYRRFAASAARHGDLTALEVGGERVGYRRLAELAESLAAAVRRESPSVPRRIGLLADRSVSAYAGYLAVQRLGSSVVPLNPAFPEARLRALPFAVRCVECEETREAAARRRQVLERRFPLFTDIATRFK